MVEVRLLCCISGRSAPAVNSVKTRIDYANRFYSKFAGENAIADARGRWSSRLVTLPIGPYSISARQTFDGNTSSWSINRRFTVSENGDDILSVKSH